MPDLHGNLTIDGPAGALEGLLKEPAAPVSRAVVVCHPHPLYGGTMHNKVVYRIAKAFYEAGFAALRFNFRGTGSSAGQHDYGKGEQDDLRCAIGFMAGRYPHAELWVAGFSFGASVVFRTACVDPAVKALVLAGLPVSTYEFEFPNSCDKPKLFVQGSDDRFGSIARLEGFVQQLSEPRELVVIEGADHFFEGRLDELALAVAGFIEETGAG